MAQKPRELGERQHEDRRTGVGSFGGWKGVVREGNPASIPDDSVWNAENVRLSGGIFSSRGGQAKVNTAAISAIQGFYDATDIGALVVAAPFTALGRYLLFPGIHSNGFNRAIISFDSTNLTTSATLLGPLYDGTTPYYVFDGFVKGSDNLIYTAGGLFNPVANSIVSMVARLATDGTITSIYSLGSVSVTNNAFGFGGDSIIEDASSALKFYAGLLGPTYDGVAAAPGKVYRDGVVDDTASWVYTNLGTGVYTFMPAAFNGTIYGAWGQPFGGTVNFSAASDTIRKRTAANTWSNITMPSPPAAGAKFSAATKPVVFGTKLWVYGLYETASASYLLPHLLSVTTGDVVTDEHTVAASVGGIVELASFNGFLYYVWTDGTAKLGRGDGSSWTDSHWDGMIAGQHYSVVALSPNVADGSSLYAVAANDTTGVEWVIKSAGTNTASWSTVVTMPAGYGVNNNVKMIAAD